MQRPRSAPGASRLPPRTFHAAALCTLLTVTALLLLPAGARATVPTVRITIDEPIREKKKVRARMTAGAGRSAYRGHVGIEHRGSSSRLHPKRSYSIETRTRDGENRNVALLGLPRENDWVLNGMLLDRSLMRDALAYATARRLGRWAPRTRFVEVTLNGRYQGVYLLAERIKLDRHRVRRSKRGIQGAYLLEASNTGDAGWFRSALGLWHLGHDDPERDDLTRRERSWIARYLRRAELAIYGRGGRWRALVDEASAVDHLLLQELFKNEDGFRRSTFLVKGSGRRLELGPIWDFDRAMANSPDGAGAGDWITADDPWSERLLADPAFMGRLARRWRELRARGLREWLLAQTVVNEVALRAAQERNAERWPQMAIPGYSPEMERLRRWLSARMDWLDTRLGGVGP